MKINEVAWKGSEDRQRNIIHSQINTLLIYVNDHLGYLGYLLNSKEHEAAHILALDDYEREKIIQTLTNESQIWKGTKDIILDYRFKMLGPHDLCLILDVPLAPPLQSIAMIRPFEFPTIKDRMLLSPTYVPSPFLQLHGNFFVKLDLPTYTECLNKGFCRGPYSPEIADSQANCALNQFFNNASAKCPYKPIGYKRYLFYTPSGSTLFYTTLKPIRIRFKCANNRVEEIKEIVGKGVLETPSSCSISSNKAIFSNPKVSKVFILSNRTLGLKAKIKDIGTINVTSKKKEFSDLPQISNLELLGIPRIATHHSENEFTFLIQSIFKIFSFIAIFILISAILITIYIIKSRRRPLQSTTEL